MTAIEHALFKYKEYVKMVSHARGIIRLEITSGVGTSNVFAAIVHLLKACPNAIIAFTINEEDYKVSKT